MRLIPYPGLPHPNLSIEVRVERDGRNMMFRYRITGEVETIRLGNPVLPRRRDDLWRTTCFEVFARPVGSQHYLELNFAPSGEWAAYDFQGYRAARKDATMGREPIIGAVQYDGGLAVDVYCDPDLDGALELNITAVIEDAHGAISYWALAHAEEKPDFHDPLCFTLTV